jgi:hypothetical protein
MPRRSTPERVCFGRLSLPDSAGGSRGSGRLARERAALPRQRVHSEGRGRGRGVAAHPRRVRGAAAPVTRVPSCARRARAAPEQADRPSQRQGG